MRGHQEKEFNWIQVMRLQIYTKTHSAMNGLTPWPQGDTPRKIGRGLFCQLPKTLTVLFKTKICKIPNPAFDLTISTISCRNINIHIVTKVS